MVRVAPRAVTVRLLLISQSDAAQSELTFHLAQTVQGLQKPASSVKRGYFIGSGAIENGNKLVWQDRLKRAGTHWNIVTAQAVLTLKTKAESNVGFRDAEQPFLSHCSSVSRNQ
jgi:hypothetical protein